MWGPQNTHYLSLRKDFFLDPPSLSTPLEILIEAEHMFYTFMVLEKPQRNCNHFCGWSKIYKLLLLLYSLFRQNVQNVRQTFICSVLHSLVLITRYLIYAYPKLSPVIFQHPFIHLGGQGKGNTTWGPQLRLTQVYCLIQSPSMILNITQAHRNS